MRLFVWNQILLSGNISTSCGYQLEMDESLHRKYQKGICPACNRHIAKKQPNPDGKTFSFVPKGDTTNQPPIMSNDVDKCLDTLLEVMKERDTWRAIAKDLAETGTAIIGKAQNHPGVPKVALSLWMDACAAYDHAAQSDSDSLPIYPQAEPPCALPQ